MAYIFFEIIQSMEKLMDESNLNLDKKARVVGDSPGRVSMNVKIS